MPGFTSYHYCSNNPVMRIDPDGRSDGNVQIPYAQKADYTNNAVVNAATFVNNSCVSVVNGAVSLINGALNIVQTPPAETASQLKSEVTNTAQGVKQFFTTPLSQHGEDAKQALTSVSFWEDFAGAAGTMLLGGALSKTSNVSATTTTNAAKISIGPGLKIADNKLIQHAHQWGLAEKGAALTSEQLGLMRKLTNHIYKNASTIRQGSWGNPASGGFKDALFYSNGKHIVVTQSNGSMITILRNATGNKHFNNATTIWTR